MVKALPLQDVTVVSLENAATAPLCSRNLADLGARVIRVERPEGEFARTIDNVLGAWSSNDLWVNASKQDVTLNLKDPRAADILYRLVERADILLENLKPGVAQQVGARYEILCEKNPRLVYCHIAGYGQDGPYRNRKAYDYIIQGETGLIELTGTPESPARVGAGVSDTVAALMLASTRS